MLDGRALAHLSGKFLNEACALFVVYQFLWVVGQEEVAEFVVDILFRPFDNHVGKALVQTVNLLHPLLLFLFRAVAAIDVLGYLVDFLADDHHGVVELLPLVVAESTADP